ncbi:Swi3-domain-containing protein [Delitschia confertaspora ATCC 74209]|uniref:Chromosome segregation in meiosis protein n=1 Tax=Delitschia confertaspora ATCC 74209 TaxID=1513339 RepID=A0A9P4N2I2_9PLEO|nr:Swi3-domain-containing protein [Delitschia confertaspora ATCC 74209]
MPAANPVSRDIPSGDELDDILNGIIDGEDVFDTSNIRASIQESDKQRQTGNAETDLGIDEEIKIVKKRQPIPKLDYARLLTPAGIPKLRRISKDRLKFKGKGHEYGDIGRMLNMYQLWLDDLYPRAKFADGLSLIEKLGHTKRIQFIRKEWIDEGKPKSTTEAEPEDADFVNTDERANRGSIAGDNAEGMEGITATSAMSEGNALDRANGRTNSLHQAEHASRRRSADEPDEDELDALFTEDKALNSNTEAPSTPSKMAEHISGRAETAAAYIIK